MILTPLQRHAAEAYPDQDVARAFLEGHTTLDDCGDTLFAFIVREAGDANDFSNMLLRAVGDLETVSAALWTTDHPLQENSYGEYDG